MANPFTARPVSGEIMTASAVPRRQRREMADLVEADYEVVAQTSAPSSAPSVEPAARIDLDDGLGMLRGSAAPAPPALWTTPGGPAFWSVGAMLVLGAFWVSGGHAMITSVLHGQTGAGPVLTISDVASHVDSSGLRPLLFVDGMAGNGGGDVAVMPELTISVTGRDGQITRYNLGTSGRTMAPGEKFAFSSRLDLPKNGVETVAVTFAE
jgi:hypothetical protein